MTYQALQQHRLREHGMCVQWCGRRARAGRVRCSTCLSKQRARYNIKTSLQKLVEHFLLH